MTGSEKQINWANEIINSTRERVTVSLNEAKARHAHLSVNAEVEQRENEILAGRTVAAELVLRKLSEIDSAKYVIDNRVNLHVALLKDNMRSLSSAEIAALQGLAKHVDSSKFFGFVFA